MVAYDPDIDRTVLLYNQITGPIFFLIALGVFLLIWFDNDTRNVVYRRIIMCMQQVLPPASKLRLRPHLFKFAIVVMEIGEFTVLICASVSLKAMLLLDDQIPEELVWVKSRPAYGVFRFRDSFFYFSIAAIIVTPPFVLLVLTLFGHIFYNLRVSMRHTSEATRRYQKRAAVTVLLLAVVPGIFLVIPFYGTLAVLISRELPFGDYFLFLEVFERPAISAALFAFSNTHSIANSLTIFWRSGKYQKIIATPFVIAFPCFRRKRQSLVRSWEPNVRRI